MICCVSVSCSPAKNAAASLTARLQICGNVRTGLLANSDEEVVIRTARACGTSRSPWQVGQPTMLMYFSSCFCCILLLLVLCLPANSGMIPSNLPPYIIGDCPPRQVNVMCSWPVPYSHTRCCSAVSSFHGESSSVPLSHLCLRSSVSATP